MTYNHLNISELSFIQNLGSQGTKAYIATKTLKRSAKTIYRFLDTGKTISEYYENYQVNKANSGRNEKYISCSMRTLYRIFRSKLLLPLARCDLEMFFIFMIL